VLADGDRYGQLCDRARQKALQNFSQPQQARRYHHLFSELLQTKPPLTPSPLKELVSP
jgi:hypothetical protein